MPEKIRFGKKQTERKEKRGIKRESQSDRKAEWQRERRIEQGTQSDRSHPIFSRSRSRRIESTSDILRRLVDVARTSSDLLIPTILTAFVRWSTPWGMIGVVCDPGYDVCACSYLRCTCVCARARALVSISAHLTPSVRLSVGLTGRSVGRFAPAWTRKRERRTREKEMRGRTRVRSLSDPTVGHATEVAIDPISAGWKKFYVVWWTTDSAHTTRFYPDGEFISHEKPESERAMIFRF